MQNNFEEQVVAEAGMCLNEIRASMEEVLAVKLGEKFTDYMHDEDDRYEFLDDAIAEAIEELPSIVTDNAARHVRQVAFQSIREEAKQIVVQLLQALAAKTEAEACV